MAITNFEDLKKYAEGTEVTLPDFSEGQPLIAMLRRVSLMTLIREGKIPNALYAAVTKIFKNSTKQEKEQEITMEYLKDNTELMEIVAKDTLVKPTYEEIQEVGLKLTESQLLAIFNFSQSGVTELESFRTKQKDNGNPEHVKGVQQKTE